MEAGAAVLNESVIYLPQVGSTNAWAKENIAQFGPVGAVYTTDQTAGRGRLGRGWVDAPGKGLYYTAVIKTDLAQPSTLPLFASLAVCDALKQRYGIDCQIKWPNDLLLNGKKIVGILCEVAPDGHSLVVGIGINLAQPQEYFDMAGLPHGTSLLLQGVNVDLDTDPEWLAQYMTDFGFDRALYTYEEQGFAPYRGGLRRRVVARGGADSPKQKSHCLRSGFSVFIQQLEDGRNQRFFSSSRRSSRSQTPSIYWTPRARSYLP